MGSLVLKKVELQLVDQHHKKILVNLLHLPKTTPQCVVAFLSGSLGGTALVHLRQLSLPGSILYKHARNVFSANKPSSKSWFWQVRDLCLMYQLPHPMTILDNPGSKFSFKMEAFQTEFTDQTRNLSLFVEINKFVIWFKVF